MTVLGDKIDGRYFTKGDPDGVTYNVTVDGEVRGFVFREDAIRMSGQIAEAEAKNAANREFFANLLAFEASSATVFTGKTRDLPLDLREQIVAIGAQLRGAGMKEGVGVVL